MIKTKLFVTIIGVLIFSNLIISQTIVPLNTGYNHWVFAPYPTVNTSPSTTRDNYWINIASYPPTNPAVGESWVLKKPVGWFTAMPSTNWISARNTASSAPGTNASKSAWTIFRKCFCLMPNFKDAKLSFKVRADDNISVYFVHQTNVALAPHIGNWNSTYLSSSPSSPTWFHAGINCIYVLVEDIGNIMGFDMQGTIQASGLFVMPAKGVNQSFGSDSCNCDYRAKTPLRIEDEDQKTVKEIVKIAEERRLKRAK